MRSTPLRNLFPRSSAAVGTPYAASARTIVCGIPASTSNGTATYSDNTAVAQWVSLASPLVLEAGTYTLSSATFTVRDATKWTAMFVRVWEKVGDVVTPVASVDITALKPANDNRQAMTVALSGSFTVVTGRSYYYGLEAFKPATGAGVSIFYLAYQTANTGVLDNDTVVWRTDSETQPATLTYSAADTAAHYYHSGSITLTTTGLERVHNRTISYTGTAKKLLLPQLSSSDYWIVMRSVVVANDQTLTAVLATTAADATLTTLATLAVNMGATNKVTFGGADVNLDTITDEAGSTFDIAINVRADGKIDTFWCNLTKGQGANSAAAHDWRDIAWRSHAVANAAARDQAGYALAANPAILQLSGTATVASIEVSRRVAIMFGDSQTGTKNPNVEGVPQVAAVTKLGIGVPAGLTYPMSVLNAGIAGNLLTASVADWSTAGEQRYRHDTPGLGDLCEMESALLVIAGIGLNDITGIGETAALIGPTVAKVSAAYATMIRYALAKGQDVLVMGLPPYSADGSASEQEATGIRQLNQALAGLCKGAGVAFYCPWWDSVDKATAGNAVPTFDLSTDDIHYSTAAALTIGALAADAYEAGLVWDRVRT